jgi:hypothetical protein
MKQNKKQLIPVVMMAIERIDITGEVHSKRIKTEEE